MLIIKTIIKSKTPSEKKGFFYETLLFVYFLEFVPTRRTKFIGIFFSFFSTVRTIHF